MSEPWGALCDVCEWSRTASSEQEAKTLQVLHTLVKHSEYYRRTTNRDPEVAAYQYDELIKAYRSQL